MLNDHLLMVNIPWPQVEMNIVTLEFETAIWSPVIVAYVPEGGKFSRAIMQAGKMFLEQFGCTADFAYVCEIPPGAQEFAELDGMTLVSTDWVQPRFVVVGRTCQHEIKPQYKNWRRVAEVSYEPA